MDVVWYGLLIGGILVAAGLATYWLAPRVGPNPIFGVRVGYSFASREVWDRTNRFGGALLVAAGIVTALLALLLQGLGVTTSSAIGLVTGVMLVLILGSTVWMILYARRLAQGTDLVRQLVPVPFRWAYLAPALIGFLVLLAVALYLYPQMPVERVASHFGVDDRPDGWMSRDSFFATILAIAGFLPLVYVGVVWLATREPVVAIERWGAGWWIDPPRGLVFGSLTIGLANLLLAAVLLNVGWYNLEGTLLFPFGWLLVLVVLLIVGIAALFFAMARRGPGPESGWMRQPGE